MFRLSSTYFSDSAEGRKLKRGRKFHFIGRRNLEKHSFSARATYALRAHASSSKVFGARIILQISHVPQLLSNTNNNFTMIKNQFCSSFLKSLVLGSLRTTFRKKRLSKDVLSPCHRSKFKYPESMVRCHLSFFSPLLRSITHNFWSTSNEKTKTVLMDRCLHIRSGDFSMKNWIEPSESK